MLRDAGRSVEEEEEEERRRRRRRREQLARGPSQQLHLALGPRGGVGKSR